uniref:Uncharacterized protein n=1 Tax=Arundo donax TaxID=35708 RepID=A0A0A8ZJU4_ARUDO
MFLVTIYFISQIDRYCHLYMTMLMFMKYTGQTLTMESIRITEIGITVQGWGV